jgi:hypothetical protein
MSAHFLIFLDVGTSHQLATGVGGCERRRILRTENLYARAFGRCSVLNALSLVASCWLRRAFGGLTNFDSQTSRIPDGSVHQDRSEYSALLRVVCGMMCTGQTVQYGHTIHIIPVQYPKIYQAQHLREVSSHLSPQMTELECQFMCTASVSLETVSGYAQRYSVSSTCIACNCGPGSMLSRSIIYLTMIR